MTSRSGRRVAIGIQLGHLCDEFASQLAHERARHVARRDQAIVTRPTSWAPTGICSALGAGQAGCWATLGGGGGEKFARRSSAVANSGQCRQLSECCKPKPACVTQSERVNYGHTESAPTELGAGAMEEHSEGLAPGHSLAHSLLVRPQPVMPAQEASAERSPPSPPPTPSPSLFLTILPFRLLTLAPVGPAGKPSPPRAGAGSEFGP